MHQCQLILLVLSSKYRPYILAVYFILKIGINRSSEKAGFEQTGKTVVLNEFLAENSLLVSYFSFTVPLAFFILRSKYSKKLKAPLYSLNFYRLKKAGID